MHTQRQLEFIEAAIKLTATEGIQKLTIRNVASAIGVSEAAVYRHFESKHELLKAILDHLNAMLSPHFTTLLNKEVLLDALHTFSQNSSHYWNTTQPSHSSVCRRTFQCGSPTARRYTHPHGEKPDLIWSSISKTDRTRFL